jgi:hypothetical protein
MPTIDYALAYDFIDPAEPTTGYRLEFRYEYRPGQDPRPSVANPSGQLVAAVKGRHRRGANIIAISRPGVSFNQVEAAVGSEHWPWHAPNKIDLAQIRARIRAAGLD